ncbi:MAG: KilA-N domain-containing protein [Emergencia timonensis]|uniref:KilA-N domain-containing protein n=1 Tax=Emergencia timonensis TaxID=1776384 RepID=UPI00082F98E0|nr:KilA-N domain-containing protein [Emergencia timonensis]WNX87558.1 KilA-N domain-containing protein [Emergencia timonensis]
MTKKEFKDKIKAAGVEITVVSVGNDDDYISLTDIAKKRNPEFPADIIKNWLRSRSTIEFLGLWERMNNPNFKLVDFDQFRIESGSNSFVLSPQKWIASTNAIGIRSKSGRYGGTFAHKDIAFEFASWISPEFKLYIIKDYQRLKEDENSRLSLDWNLRRTLSKTNYKIHTDAIKEHLIPEDLSKKEQGFTYANEADVLNVALFGMTAKEWRDKNPNAKRGDNIRDSATLEQLIVLTNLESYNAELIKDGVPQHDRLIRLNQAAINQLNSLIDNPSVEMIKDAKLLK